MKLAVDLHIHTALSPCAEDDMTPGNIVNMAALKGLDAIAITDHNCCFNLRAAGYHALKAGVLLIPGIEVTTAEEAHMLVYFEEIGSAEAFGQLIYGSLADFKNRTDIFGTQLLFGVNDEIAGELPKMLAQAAPFTVEALQKKAREYGGFMMPAHINRKAYSILETLGFIPDGLMFSTVEIRRNMPLDQRYAVKYNTISSSDAHCLWQILEREEFVEAEEKSIRGVLKALQKRKGA